MDKKKYLIFALAVAVIAAIAIFLFISAKKANESLIPSESGADIIVAPVSDDGEMRSVVNEFGVETPFQEIIEPEEIPETALQLSISESGFSPAEFKVRAGQKVNLALSAGDSGPHVFIFLNLPTLNLTAMVFENQTQLLEFTAPEPGIYNFRDDIAAYRQNTGRMIVEE